MKIEKKIVLISILEILYQNIVSFDSNNYEKPPKQEEQWIQTIEFYAR